jgi:hypothetical protein
MNIEDIEKMPDSVAHENALQLISQADRALAMADTVVKAKELKDLALTAADWLKRKGASEEIINKARALALDAERRMGEMLKIADKNKGTVLGGNTVLPPDNTPGESVIF